MVGAGEKNDGIKDHRRKDNRNSSVDPYKDNKKEQELRDELSICLTSYYAASVAGVLIGMPLSLKLKRYEPFIVGGVLGTAIDFGRAKKECAKLQEALDSYIESNK
jgi:hypothetical protein